MVFIQSHSEKCFYSEKCFQFDKLFSHFSRSRTDWLQEEFGEMNATTGNEHEFLGIIFRVREDKRAEMDMKK